MKKEDAIRLAQSRKRSNDDKIWNAIVAAGLVAVAVKGASSALETIQEKSGNSSGGSYDYSYSKDATTDPSETTLECYKNIRKGRGTKSWAGEDLPVYLVDCSGKDGKSNGAYYYAPKASYSLQKKGYYAYGFDDYFLGDNTLDKALQKLCGCD